MAVKNLGKVVPKKGVDYFTEEDIKSLNIPTKTSQLINDSGFTTDETIIESIEPLTDDIPKVFINGSIPTDKTDVLAEMTYISKTEEFHSYIKIKCQGTSSMSYPKKNFTVKLYSDEERSTKLKKNFKGWGNQNKFCLKANYIDHSHARNIISANLWSEVVASRSNYNDLPEELRTSPRNGAIDGFPIKVYTNGTYQGIYTWNIPKDDWLYNMDSDNTNHALLCAETNTDGTYAENACNFRALWNGIDGSNWSIEVGTNSDALKTSLNNLITCVKDTDDETFKATIGNYLDIQSAIDYYLHQYVICGLDGLAKNMLLATYDGTKWYCGAYDMDSTFGLFWNGTSFVATTYRCPEQYQEQFSLLWERIELLYKDELKARYSELRNSVYSLENMFTKFERFTDLIGNDLYEEDVTIYTGIPSKTTNNITQIRNYIRDRLTYVDGEIENLLIPIECTGITLNTNTLEFTSTDSQTLIATVEPSDTTDTITWESNDTTVAKVNNGIVTPLKNGNCLITATCGSQSATCNVVITGINEPIDATLLYSLPEETVFDGTNYIDTNIQLFDEDKDFTVLLDFRGASDAPAASNVIHNCLEQAPYPGFNLNIGNGSKKYDINYYGAIKSSDKVIGNTDRNKIVLTHEAGTHILNYHGSFGEGVITPTKSFSTFTQNVLLGTSQKIDGTILNYWKGIIYNCDIYNKCLSSTEIENFLNSTTEQEPSLLYSLPEETVFDGTNYIDTEKNLLADEDKDFTVLLDFTGNSSSANDMALMHNNLESTPYSGISFDLNQNHYRLAVGQKYIVSSISVTDTARHKIVIKHYKGTNFYVLNVDGIENTLTSSITYIDQTLVLGGKQSPEGTVDRFWKGTIHEFEVYQGVLTDEEINSFLGISS